MTNNASIDYHLFGHTPQGIIPGIQKVGKTVYVCLDVSKAEVTTVNNKIHYDANNTYGFFIVNEDQHYLDGIFKVTGSLKEIYNNINIIPYKISINHNMLEIMTVNQNNKIIPFIDNEIPSTDKIINYQLTFNKDTNEFDQKYKLLINNEQNNKQNNEQNNKQNDEQNNEQNDKIVIKDDEYYKKKYIKYKTKYMYEKSMN